MTVDTRETRGMQLYILAAKWWKGRTPKKGNGRLFINKIVKRGKKGKSQFLWIARESTNSKYYINV